MNATRQADPGVPPNVGAAIAAELRAAVHGARDWLDRVATERSRLRPHPAAWSPREIIGHLIDSASNNHGRFVRGALDESLVFPGYDQDGWVALHQYQAQDWSALLERWSAFNEQVASAVERIPVDVLARRRREHNLHQIAWRTVPAEDNATLEYFIRDYIAHLQHHLAQISRAVRD